MVCASRAGTPRSARDRDAVGAHRARLPGRAGNTRSPGRFISRPALLDCLPRPRRTHHGSKYRGGSSPVGTKPSPPDCVCRRARCRTKSHTRNTYGPQNPASAHGHAVRPARASMNDGKNDNVIAASATKSIPMCAAIRGRLPVPSRRRLPDPAVHTQKTPVKGCRLTGSAESAESAELGTCPCCLSPPLSTLSMSGGHAFAFALRCH